MSKISITKKAQKQIEKLPKHIRVKFGLWADGVESLGIQETRKRPGFHDEPLLGTRTGQRSVRLSISYRAIYVERQDEITIEVIEVNKHDY
jgi:proteic killer suppression protein